MRLKCVFHIDQTLSLLVKNGKYYCLTCKAIGSVKDSPRLEEAIRRLKDEEQDDVA